MSCLIENTLRMSFLKCEQTISHKCYRVKSEIFDSRDITVSAGGRGMLCGKATFKPYHF